MNESGFQFAEQQNLRRVAASLFQPKKAGAFRQGSILHDRMRDYGLIDQINGVIRVPFAKD
jgi:hypothetical protein